MREFLKTFGVFGLARLVFYPVTLLATSPLVLLKTILNTGVLFRSNVKNYLHFSAYQSVNFLFYKTRWLNVKRYGLTGISPHIGPGNVNLSRNFHYPMFSLNLYMLYGGRMIFLSMLGWLGAHFIWFNDVDGIWFTLCLVLTAASTMFYASTFRFMNYNALGWVAFPFFIFFMLNENYLLSSIMLLLISFGSITATFIGIALAIGWLVVGFKFSALWLVIPALFKLVSHLWPFLNKANRKSAASLKQGVGATNDVKYKRKNSKGFGVVEWYHLILIAQFGGYSYYLTETIPWLLIGCCLLYIINAKFIRFADIQSIYLSILSISLPMILNQYDVLYLVSFWLMIAPIPRITGFYSYPKILDVMPVMKPYNLEPIVLEIEHLISEVKEGDKLLLAYKNPENLFENIFDGYRALVEGISFVCNEKRVHMLPDWWYINDNNFAEAENVWGVNPISVKENMKKLGCAFAIVYHDQKNKIDWSIWESQGLILKSSMDWGKFKDDFYSHKKMKVANLKWYLIELKG